KVAVPTTLNPAGMDLLRWKEIGFEENFAKKQLLVANTFESMGITPTYTCTPYLAGNRPKKGEHIAWAESSAISYANSVLGALTNREGGPTSLASALTGKTPFFGLHMKKGRRPSHVINTKFSISKPIEYSALGYTIGKISGLKIPFIKAHLHPGTDELKALAASLAASGSTPMFHMEGVTLENKEFTKYLGECEHLEIEEKDIKETLEELSTDKEFNFVCIGCPHCSLTELEKISKLLGRRKTNRNLWVFTSRYNRKIAERKGYVNTIEKAGGKVVSDTCMVVAPLEKFGFSGAITNSCKAAHYLPSTCKLDTRLLGLEECIDATVKKSE
ncbi:MAG: aconitase X catalytic domain-containing protein, partial [Candidatus Bathyarchaeota archaeon]